MRNSRRLPHAFLAAPLLVTAALSFAACGDDDDSADPGSPASAPAAAGGVVVTGLDGIKWDAKSYTATAGDVPITLRNQSSLAHTLAVLAADGTKIGEELKTGSRGDEQTGTYSLVAGTYTIICTVAGHGGMKADLVVT
jgi:plastocyanin